MGSAYYRKDVADWLADILKFVALNEGKTVKIDYHMVDLRRSTFSQKFSNGKRFLIDQSSPEEKAKWIEFFDRLKTEGRETYFKFLLIKPHAPLYKVIGGEECFDKHDPETTLARYIEKHPTVQFFINTGLLKDWKKPLLDFLESTPPKGAELVLYYPFTSVERKTIASILEGYTMIHCEIVTPRVMHLVVLAEFDSVEGFEAKPD
jgi:hypothetical protein